MNGMKHRHATKPPFERRVLKTANDARMKAANGPTQNAAKREANDAADGGAAGAVVVAAGGGMATGLRPVRTVAPWLANRATATSTTGPVADRRANRGLLARTKGISNPGRPPDPSTNQWRPTSSRRLATRVVGPTRRGVSRRPTRTATAPPPWPSRWSRSPARRAGRRRERDRRAPRSPCRPHGRRGGRRTSAIRLRRAPRPACRHAAGRRRGCPHRRRRCGRPWSPPPAPPAWRGPLRLQPGHWRSDRLEPVHAGPPRAAVGR